MFFTTGLKAQFIPCCLKAIHNFRWYTVIYFVVSAYSDQQMCRFIFIFILVQAFGLNAYAQDVFKTPSGKKYHLASCRMVENVSEKISVEQAAKLGLQPCRICQPQAVPNQLPVSKEGKGQSSTVQCKGKTKAGNRCRHKTRIANGFCYQHQPG